MKIWHDHSNGKLMFYEEYHRSVVDVAQIQCSVCNTIDKVQYIGLGLKIASLSTKKLKVDIK